MAPRTSTRTRPQADPATLDEQLGTARQRVAECATLVRAMPGTNDYEVDLYAGVASRAIVQLELMARRHQPKRLDA